jgi:hypothetical protein
MVRSAVVGLLVVGVSLGCAGTEQFNEDFEAGFHKSFLENCAPAGSSSDQVQLCTCVADRVVGTKTPAELTAMLADPEAAVAPFVEKCSKKLSRQKGQGR